MCFGYYEVCQKFVVEGWAYDNLAMGGSTRSHEKLLHHGQVCEQGEDVDAVEARLPGMMDEYCRKPIMLIDGRRFECKKDNPVVEKSPIQVTKLRGFWDVVFDFFGKLLQ